LAVDADEGRFNFCGGDGGLEGFSVGEAEAPVKAGQLSGSGGGVGLSGHGGKDGVAESGRIGEGTVGEEGELWGWPTQANGGLEWDTRLEWGGRGNFDEGNVDAVGGSAAHDAGDDHR
jgi:hypothetical protein